MTQSRVVVPAADGSKLQSRRRRDLIELACGYGLILAVLWTPAPWQRRLYAVAALFLLAASLRPGESWRGLGFSPRNLWRASPVALLAAAVAALAGVVADRVGTLHGPSGATAFVHRYWGYVIWSSAQQFLLQDFFLLRFRRLLPERNGLAIVAAAGIFAAAHLPSPVLTVFTLVWGLIACASFMRYRCLYPLAVAHAILGITVAVCLPVSLTHNMHVGLGYFAYKHPHRHPQRRVSDQTVSTRV